MDSFLSQSITALFTNPFLLLSALPVVCAAYIVYQRFISPLASIPGPFTASISQIWLVKHSWDGDMPKTLIALHERYGPLVRTGPNEVSVADLPAFKTIFAVGSKFRKSDWYSVLQGHRKFDLVSERDEKIHSAQRKLTSRPYSKDYLKDLEPFVEDCVKVFLKKMSEKQGQTVDIGKWLQMFAFDVIGEITFSKPFGFMEAGSDDGTFKNFHGIGRCAAWIGYVPYLYWIHEYLMPYIGNYLPLNKRHGTLRNFASREIMARKERGTDRNDILSKLFAQNKEKPDEFDFDAVVSMASSNISAGSDTTAISLKAIFYYLLKNPQYKQKLIDEIDEGRKQGKLSDPVKLEEADEMPYLQAVMYEGLRMHPAVGLTLPRVVPEGGAQIGGKYMPAKTVVGVNAWVLHRNREVFGDDADLFRPDRWLKEDTRDMHRFFFSFGAGARKCMGSNISWMEMSKLIPTLFMHYNLELADPDAVWKVSCWFLAVQTEVYVKLSRRRS